MPTRPTYDTPPCRGKGASSRPHARCAALPRLASSLFCARALRASPPRRLLSRTRLPARRGLVPAATRRGLVPAARAFPVLAAFALTSSAQVSRCGIAVPATGCIYIYICVFYLYIYIYTFNRLLHNIHIYYKIIYIYIYVYIYIYISRRNTPHTTLQRLTALLPEWVW